MDALVIEAALNGGTPKSRNPNVPRTLIAAYYGSDRWQALQPQTQRTYRLILERFREEHGHRRAADLTDAHLQVLLDRMADRPAAARNLLKRLRSVFAVGVKRKLVRVNPTLGVELAKRRTDGFRAWTDVDIEAFEAHWPSGSRARLALALLLYTGQRRSDVVLMGWQHVRGDRITVTQTKRNPQSPATTLQIRLHPALKAELDSMPKTQMTFLVTAYGAPMSAVGFSNWFSECAAKAGLPKNSSPHGLRKAAARRLAEAGCSAHEIAAVTGHASLKEVERYTQSVRQTHLADRAIAALADRG
jgi:integrase